MYLQDPHTVDGFAEVLKKVRTAVHKIFPRELSPSRLAEKFGADAKKKGAKKIAAVSLEVDAHAAAGDALLQMQMDTLNAAAPRDGLPVEIAPDFSPAGTAMRAPVLRTGSWTPWLVAGSVAFLVFAAARRARR